MNMLTKVNKMLMKPLALLENKYISGGVKLFLIVYTGVKDPMMSLLVAVGFTVSMLTLNKLETVGNLNELIDGAIDVPQSLLNDVVDGAQELTGAAADLIGAPVTDVVGVVEQLVDGAQEIVNKVVDGAQEMITGTDAQENFSMEDRTMSMDMQVPDMGSLDGLSGFEANVVGAEL